MAKRNVISYFKEFLLQFLTEADPLLSMLQWLTQQLMQMEAELKVGAEKGRHIVLRNTYFSGHRVRRFDTRLGTTYLLVPKLRKGGYIPFFVVERKRSEQALIQVVQEAFINGVSTRKIERLAKSPARSRRSTRDWMNRWRRSGAVQLRVSIRFFGSMRCTRRSGRTVGCRIWLYWWSVE